MRDIGKNIKSYRIKNNMKQEELAEKLFVTRQTVSNYETGKSRPDIDMLVRISEVFNIDVDKLINGEKEDDFKGRILFTIISLCMVILLCLLYHCFMKWGKAYELKHSEPIWIMFCLYTLRPVLCAICGFLITRIIQLLTKTRYRIHISEKHRHIIGALILIWMIFQLIYPVQMFFWNLSLLGLENVNSTFYGFLYPLGFNLFFTFTYRYWPLYIIYGALLSLITRKDSAK